MLRDILFVLVVCSVLFLIFAYFLIHYVSIRITNPVLALTSIAKKMAQGQYRQDINVQSNDEIGFFANTFKEMSEAITKRDEELASLNKNLEKLVEQRTQELFIEMKKVKNLLNNMRQAVFTVGADGLIVAPVSSYSTTIFKQDIVHENVFSVLFKDIGESSEEYSLLKTALAVVYGENEIQWTLMEDNLTKRVEIFDEKSKDRQILKVAYTPLWNEKGTLEHIMFIVEDVSLIEKLEKEIAEQKKESNRRTQILHELSCCSFEDASVFITTNLNFLDRVQHEFHSIVSSTEQVKELFRNLHTLKGNARTFGLSYISKAAHETENIIVKIKECMANDGAIDEKLINDGNEHLLYIYSQIQEYSDYLERIFKIENGHKTRILKQIHKYIINLEYELSEFFPNIKLGILGLAPSLPADVSYLQDLGAGGLFYDERIISKINGLLELVKKSGENSLIIDVETLSSKIKGKYPQEFSKDRVEQLYQSFFSLCFNFKEIYQRSPLFRSYQDENMDWVEIFQASFEVSQSYLASSHDYSINKNILLLQSVQGAWNKAQGSSFEFVQFLFEELEKILLEHTDFDRPLFEKYLKQLWNYLGLVSSVDVGLHLNSDQMRSFIVIMGQLENGIVSTDMLNFQDFDSLFLVFLCAMSSRPSLIQEFIRVVTSVLEINPKEMFEKFIPSQNIDSAVEFVFETMSNFCFTPESMSKFLNDQDPFVRSMPRIFSIYSEKRLYLFVMDFLKLLDPYIVTEDSLKRQSYQTLKIPIINFNRLKSFIKNLMVKEALDINNKHYFEILTRLNSLTEISVKSSLVRNFSMVEDISRRLGKKVDFKISGSDFTISKEELILLQDSIAHMLRNALDHGIEFPEERVSSGKSEKGNLSVIISVENGIPKIEVSDDGRGIDPMVVGKRAIEKHIITRDQANSLSEQDLIDLVFLPYLSCKEVVTDLSGRGIGMDIVRNNVKKMGGSVTLFSQKSKGTKIVIYLDQ